MSLERHLRESMLRTTLLHLLKDQKRCPERTARNILEMLLRFNPSGQADSYQYENLLKAIGSRSKEDCVNWIMDHLS